MNIKIPSLDNARKNAHAKMLEGYEKMGKLIEDGSVDPLYPENPAVDAAQVAASVPDKTVTVNSALLRDLLNWATSADAASIDNVVAKAEELGAAGPMGPEKLIDLTGAAGCQQPGCSTNPETPGTAVPAVGTQTTPGMPIPAGPTGPLSPVMASFMRRGKKVEENKNLKEDDIIDSDNEVIVNPDEMKKPVNKGGFGLPLGDKLNKGNNGMLEDDIIASDHEVIVTPDEMGKKNPEIKPDGGQEPEGLPLDNPLNKGNAGLQEDGLDIGDGEAAEIGNELDAEGSLSDDGQGAEITVDPAGEEVGIAGDEVAPVVDGGPEVTPEVSPMPAAPTGGLVQQISDLQAKIAELEAIVKGGAAPSPVSPVDGAMDAVADVADDVVGAVEGGLDAEEGDELEVGDDTEEDSGEEKEAGDNPFASDDKIDGEETEETGEEDEEKSEEPEEKEEK